MIAELAVGPAAELRGRERAEAPAKAARQRRPSVSVRRRGERRLLVCGVVLSVAVHLVVLLTVSIRPLDWSTRGEVRTPQVIELPAFHAIEIAPHPPAPVERVQEESIRMVSAVTESVIEPDLPVAEAEVPRLAVEPLAAPADSVPASVAQAVYALETAERGRYEQEVTRWVERQRAYPLAARQRRLEGTAIVRIELDGDGALLDARLVRDTGHAVLDRAALDMIHRAAPYPSVPRSLSSSTVEVLVPIQFTLSR